VTDAAERKKLLAEAAALRERAREARALANEVQDDLIRSILKQRAADCDKEAEALEARARVH